MLSPLGKLVLALLIAVSVGAFGHAVIRLLRLLALGQPEDRFDQLGHRVKNFIVKVLFQPQLLRKPLVGAMHLAVFWGFIIFSIATINHFIGGFVDGFSIFFGTKLGAYYAAIVDAFGLIVLIAIVGLTFRRYVLKPECLRLVPSPESAVVLFLIGGLMVTFLLGNAAEIAMGSKPYGEYYFAARTLAALFGGAGQGTLRTVFSANWWLHAVMILAFLVFIPNSKHLHLLACPFNEFFYRTRPRGQMTALDLEDENSQTFGVSKIEEYTWKQLLDLYSCIECGRCQENCPAHSSDKPLNPKKVIIDLKHHLIELGPTLIKKAGATEPTEEDDGRTVLGGTVIEEDAIWACTTCGACMEHCPISIEHIDKLTDIRRYLVLTESRFPREAVAVFKNMENNGNPWGIAWTERAEWAGELDVHTLAEKQETDVLFWVGCCGAYDERNKKVAEAMVRIFKAAGTEFAILGQEEKCCGDSARRLGNEYLFQMLAETNIETMDRYKFNRIVATCPHGFNTLKHEYPQFGGRYEVVHHTEFIHELISAGKLELGSNGAGPVAYHDSCYLGRHNGIYDEPRSIVEAAGHRVVPVSQDRTYALCCGGGGGRMWLEETLGSRINHMRTDQLIATGATQIGTACPFCLTMIEDGIKETNREGAARVRDVAELVAQSIEI